MPDDFSPPLSEDDIKYQLQEMGIDVLEPQSKREINTADAIGAFSSFVLEEERELCQEIIEQNMGATAGALQGGSDEYEIYRVLITAEDDDGDGGAVGQLLSAFHSSPQGKRYTKVLTVSRLEQYMLGMCERRSRTRHCRRYTRLGNFMLILTFGKTDGQVRHIDNMDPNLQVCLYMSHDCPSTIVYALGGAPILNSEDLVHHWDRTCSAVPELIKTILSERGDMKLADMVHTKYFAFWDTINTNLRRFGKLYRPVSLPLALELEPGTTLLAGGNEVHAGPPTAGPRMFAFAIGIPEEGGDCGQSDDDGDEEGEDVEEDNDGEVQYCPGLLHVDLCCILFSIMDLEYPGEREDERGNAKRFLLELLLPFIREYPKETYARQLDDKRSEVRDWLGKLVEAIEDGGSVDILMQQAVRSESMFYGPDMGSAKAKKRRQRRKKKNKQRVGHDRNSEIRDYWH